MRQQGAVLSEYHYDEQHRLKEHRVHPLDHNGEVTGHYHYHYRRSYQYDANSNLRLLTDSRKGQNSYAYDPLDRLTEVIGFINHVEHFAHDPAGNLLSQSYNGQGRSHGKIKGNRLLMQGDCHFDYDAYGRRIAKDMDVKITQFLWQATRK